MAVNYYEPGEFTQGGWYDTDTGQRYDSDPSKGGVYGSPWANDRTGWTTDNLDALYEKYARSDAGAVGPQTLAKMRELGVDPNTMLESLWTSARESANPNWAGGSPTGISRGIWQKAGVLDRLDNPQLQQAQKQEDQSIWAGQQQGGNDWGGLGLGLGVLGAAFGLPWLGAAFNFATTGEISPMSLLSAGIGGLSGFDAGSFGGEGLSTDFPLAGWYADAAGSSASGSLQDALNNPNVGGSLTGSYSTPGYTGAGYSVPSMTYMDGALGGGVPTPTIPLDGGWSFDKLWQGAKDVYNNPATKLATQAGRLIASGDKGQPSGDNGFGAFNAQLAALIAAANGLRSREGGASTFGASQAVAPDRRAVPSLLKGSSGVATDPDAAVAAMGKPAPVSPQFASSGTSTPPAPSMPQSQQGAVRLPVRPRMYA